MATPAPASSTQPTSRARREPASATPSGPRNSIVTATPSGIREIASKKASVSSPEQTPSATAAARSSLDLPRIRGRANGHSISAASASRRATTPAGEISSNSGSESAAPSWIVTIAATARPIPEARVPGTIASAVVAAAMRPV